MNVLAKREIITVPLNHLSVAAENVRRIGAKDNLDQLTASIAVKGVLQPLHVRPNGKKGHFEVCAGQRRLAALLALKKGKTINASEPIRCVLVSNEEAREVSLTENVIRAPMHPIDQFKAFAQLAEDKMGIADIAARFGISEQIVKQRLKLANVAPELLTLYEDGEINLNMIEAFTLTDDQDRQVAAYDEAYLDVKIPYDKLIRILHILNEGKENPE